MFADYKKIGNIIIIISGPIMTIFGIFLIIPENLLNINPIFNQLNLPVSSIVKISNDLTLSAIF